MSHSRHERLVAQLLLNMPLAKVTDIISALDDDVPAAFPTTMRPVMTDLAGQLSAALDRDDLSLHEKVAIENLAKMAASAPDTAKSLLAATSLGTIAAHPAAEVLRFLVVNGVDVIGTPAVNAACAKNQHLRYFMSVYRKESAK